jgi:ABC-type antimicrobial peptide transport system permease subunit
VTAVRSIAEIKWRAMATETFQMTLLTVFAAIGLLLAGAGIYGLVAYSVGQRTREFGIRMALGARPGAILRSIIVQGASLALVGVAVGTIAAALGAKWLQTFLFEVSTHDLKTFVIVGAILVAVAAMASLVPALRAVRLNPVSALRE